MSFKYSIAAQNGAGTMNELLRFRDDLLDVTAEYYAAKTELQAHCAQETTITNVMDNIVSSIESLSTSDDPEIMLRVLNADDSLCVLVGVAEAQLTVAAANESLGSALKDAWNSFVEWCKRLIEKVKNFFKRIIAFFTGQQTSDAQVSESVKKCEQLIAANAQIIDDCNERLEEMKKSGAKTRRGGRVISVADKAKTELKNFNRVASDPKSSPEDCHKAATKAIEAAREVKRAVSEQPSATQQDKPVPEPPDATVNCMNAQSCDAAAEAVNQLINALPPMWNTQYADAQRFCQDVFDNFTPEKAKTAVATMHNNLANMVKAINNALTKVDEELLYGDGSSLSYKVHDVSHKNKLETTCRKISELGYKDQEEAVGACGGLRRLIGNASKEIAKLSEGFDIYPDNFYDSVSAKDVPKEQYRAIMQVIRQALRLEQIVGLLGYAFREAYDLAGNTVKLANAEIRYKGKTTAFIVNEVNKLW